MLLALCVGGLLDHGAEDWFEEARVLGKGGAIVGDKGGFDGLLRGRCDQFDAADKDAGDIPWRWIDVEWEHGVDECARDDVNEPRAFFKPGRFPGFQHGVRFVGKESFGNESPFESGRKGIEGAIEGGRIERGLIAEWAEDAITELRSATFKEDDVGNGFA